MCKVHVSNTDPLAPGAQEARRNLQYWADMRAPKGESLGGPEGTGVAFLQAAAEAIPQPDETYDVVRAQTLRT
jgi:hypothetical protein